MLMKLCTMKLFSELALYLALVSSRHNHLDISSLEDNKKQEGPRGRKQVTVTKYRQTEGGRTRLANQCRFRKSAHH